MMHIPDMLGSDQRLQNPAYDCDLAWQSSKSCSNQIKEKAYVMLYQELKGNGTG